MTCWAAITFTWKSSYMAVSSDLLKDVPGVLPINLANLRRFMVMNLASILPFKIYQPSPNRVWKLINPNESHLFLSNFQCLSLKFSTFLGKQVQLL